MFNLSAEEARAEQYAFLSLHTKWTVMLFLLPSFSYRDFCFILSHHYHFLLKGIVSRNYYYYYYLTFDLFLTRIRIWITASASVRTLKPTYLLFTFTLCWCLNKKLSQKVAYQFALRFYNSSQWTLSLWCITVR